MRLRRASADAVIGRRSHSRIGFRRVESRIRVLAATGVWLAAVVRLRAAGAQFTSFCLCHSEGSVPVPLEYRRRTLGWSDGWLTCVVLEGFGQRRAGIRGVGDPVMLWTRSIHTFGMDRAIESVWIDKRGVVESIRRLSPGRLVVRSRPFVVIEAFELDRMPNVGDRVTVLA